MPFDPKYGRVILEHPGSIEDNEPVIVLRGRDKAAVRAIKTYKAICEQMGSQEYHLESIQHLIAMFERWQLEHGSQIPQSESARQRSERGVGHLKGMS